jgi:hypothetical protein
MQQAPRQNVATSRNRQIHVGLVQVLAARLLLQVCEAAQLLEATFDPRLVAAEFSRAPHEPSVSRPLLYQEVDDLNMQ